MTKFSGELITAELSLLCFVSALSVYLLLIRKKKKESAEWVPAAIVRAYLDRVRAEEAEVRFKLFGEASAPVATQAPLAAALNSVTTVTDPALVKEVEALRAQLSTSDQRAMEFDRMISALRAEKTALEEKLKAAPASAGETPAAAAAPAEALKELEDLKAKLQEYEVIEDDLANLKKFQKENEQLRQKMEQYEKGGATVVSGAPAQPEVKMVVSGGEEKAAPTMTLVSGGTPAAEAAPAAVAVAAAEPVAAAPAPVSVAAETPAPAPAPEANTNVLAAETAAAAAPVATAAPEAASVAPAATVVAEAAPAASGEAPATSAAAPAAPAAEEKSAKQKEEELLSEFEKMLAS
jgi:hypothetical protein